MSAFSIIVIGLIIFGIYKYAVFTSIGSPSHLNSKPQDLNENQKEQIYQMWSELTGLKLNSKLKTQFFENKHLPRINRHSKKNQRNRGRFIVEQYNKWNWKSFDEKPKPLDLKNWADMLDSIASSDWYKKQKRINRRANRGYTNTRSR